jgi:hypothetical protein
MHIRPPAGGHSTTASSSVRPIVLLVDGAQLSASPAHEIASPRARHRTATESLT